MATETDQEDCTPLDVLARNKSNFLSDGRLGSWESCIFPCYASSLVFTILHVPSLFYAFLFSYWFLKFCVSLSILVSVLPVEVDCGPPHSVRASVARHESVQSDPSEQYRGQGLELLLSIFRFLSYLEKNLVSIGGPSL